MRKNFFKNHATLFVFRGIKNRKKKTPAGERQEVVIRMELKKENKLADDELEQVVGGSLDPMSEDSKFLNVLLRGEWAQCGRYGAWKVGAHIKEVERAWAYVGVDFFMTVTTGASWGKTGEYHYRINGNEVSRYEAWVHAEQVMRKHLKHSDWDW